MVAHLKQSNGFSSPRLMMVVESFTSNNLMVFFSRSEGGGGSSGLRKFESRASLNTSINNESPSLASKFGSSFTVNKHKKVLLFFFTTWDRSMFQWLGSSCDYHFDHQRHSRLTLTHLTNLNLRPKEEKRDFLRFTFISEYHPTKYPLMSKKDQFASLLCSVCSQLLKSIWSGKIISGRGEIAVWKFWDWRNEKSRFPGTRWCWFAQGQAC